MSELIFVNANPLYVPEQSDPMQKKFVWSYEITITNESNEIIQLLKRHWKITDLYGRIEDVEGLGVIGQQPIIKPKRQFNYTSFCQLYTPQGTMEGYYEVQNLKEEFFNVIIPKFKLEAPTVIKQNYQSKLH